MSYVLRYILSHRKVRRGKSFKMILAICCYADDITVYGRISNLTKVMKDTTRWAKETLGLTIKSAWDIIHFASFDAERHCGGQSCVPSAIWMLWGMCRGGEHSAL